MTPKEHVELVAIGAARGYAAANGRPGDATAIGLFLAGLVIGARTSDAARPLLIEGYSDQFPEQSHVLDRWANAIDEAAS